MLVILQMSDTPQIESSVYMLRAAGYEVKVCSDELIAELKRIGCDTVISSQGAVSYGCDPLDPSIEYATIRDVDRCMLWCEIKLNNIAKILTRWPNLRDRIAWWRVNGARPEHVIKQGGYDCGNEPDPGHPVITANLWYAESQYANHGRNYTFWPPYTRANDYMKLPRQPTAPPICLCHGVEGWGFRGILFQCLEMSVEVYGHGSPKGPVKHSRTPELLSKALATVHIKASDCPGWALYESLLAECPVIVGRCLVSRMRGYDLYQHESTCLLFGVDYDEITKPDVRYDLCVQHIQESLTKLKDVKFSRHIGRQGRVRLQELMWSPDRDGESFKQYLNATFRK